jgi:iron uptake system component EfeO
MRFVFRASAALFPLAVALAGCGSDNDRIFADAAHDAKAAADAKALLVAHATDLHEAAEKLCAAAPAPAADGWKLSRDGASLAAMKKAWKDAHRAYVSVAGAAEMLHPDLAAELDARYEDALAKGPDPDLFSAEGFIGLHAIERVLWADRIPASVTESESQLPGYVAAAFPANTDEAERFRTGLCARLVEDTDELLDEIREASLDSSAAYEAALRIIEGQTQKLVDAGDGREESRYAGYSLADLSAGAASAKAIHAVFQEWLLTKKNGEAIDGAVRDGFARLEKEYAAFGSDALPYVPAGWSVSALTHEARETPFGQLYTVVSFESDASLNGSLALAMTKSTRALGIQER